MTFEIRCKNCGFAGPLAAFPPSIASMRDLDCPRCGSARLDTGELEAGIPGYVFGSNNLLRITAAR